MWTFFAMRLSAHGAAGGGIDRDLSPDLSTTSDLRVIRLSEAQAHMLWAGGLADPRSASAPPFRAAEVLVAVIDKASAECANACTDSSVFLS